MASDQEPKSTRHFLSRNGIDFILRKEGDGSKLYIPGGNSGMTIGHGYDLKDRRRGDVETDLRRAGVDAADATIIAQGAGLSGFAARDFIRKNASISISSQTQARLLEMTIQSYVDDVNHLVRVPLTQRQFDALVSFAYNEGSGRFRHSTLLRHINDGDFKQAAEDFQDWTIMNGKPVRGLIIRRGEESQAFYDGKARIQ